MNNTAVNKRAAILSRISSSPLRRIKVPSRVTNNNNNHEGSAGGFAPVEITDLPEKESNQIEVIFPSGVQVILTGPQNLSSLASLIKQGI